LRCIWNLRFQKTQQEIFVFIKKEPCHEIIDPDAANHSRWHSSKKFNDEWRNFLFKNGDKTKPLGKTEAQVRNKLIEMREPPFTLIQ
jgi:hypothetical protein